MASGFVTEAELEERKKVRQEEWEKVRKPEDPVAAPEEPVDNRSLWARLEEQKQKKQAEWDEEHQFKNQFRGLNDDEVLFLDKVDDIRYCTLVCLILFNLIEHLLEQKLRIRELWRRRPSWTTSREGRKSSERKSC